VFGTHNASIVKGRFIGRLSMGKLFIGNIPHVLSESDLRQWVESHGFLIQSMEIIRDRSTGESRGYGFVVLKEEWKVTDAIAVLNGRRLHGRALTVNQAVPLPPRDSGRSRAA